MATAADLIKGSLRLLGAIASGETPTAAEQADGLSALNDMLESWSNERLIVYSVVQRKFPLVSGTGSYTIGSGGTFNAPRPIKIESASIELQGSSPKQEVPLKILTKDEWARISIKDEQSSVPCGLFIDDAYPLATIYLHQVPAAAEKLVIYPWEPLTSFASAATSVSLPPGYSRALKYNLAIELAPEYEKEPSASIVAIANDSKASIKRANVKPVLMECDAGVLSGSSCGSSYRRW